MAIIFHCPHCDERHRVDPARAGKSGPCKQCGKKIRVPVPVDELPDGEDVELAPSGSPIWRHEPRKVPFDVAFGDSDLIEAISGHIEEHLGPVANVLHELVSDLVHIDVHVVEPTNEVPYYRLVTSGMSDAPMSVPDELRELRFAELMVTLPRTWSLEQEDWQDEANYWPIRWLKTLARFPHEYDTWLGFGHTIPNGDPPEPFADGTQQCCLLVLPSPTVPEGFHKLETADGKQIHFYSLVPLYREEMNLKLRKGTEDLLNLFDRHGVQDVIDPARKNVARKGWRFWQ
jgi:hypothetical protein